MRANNTDNDVLVIYSIAEKKHDGELNLAVWRSQNNTSNYNLPIVFAPYTISMQCMYAYTTKFIFLTCCFGKTGKLNAHQYFRL